MMNKLNQHGKCFLLFCLMATYCGAAEYHADPTLNGAAFADATGTDYDFSAAYAKGVKLSGNETIITYKFILPPSSAGTYTSFTVTIAGKGGMFAPQIFLGSAHTANNFVESAEGSYTATVDANVLIDQFSDRAEFIVNIKAGSWNSYQVKSVGVDLAMTTANSWLDNYIEAYCAYLSIIESANVMDNWDFEDVAVDHLILGILKAHGIAESMQGMASDDLNEILDSFDETLDQLQEFMDTLSSAVDWAQAQLDYLANCDEVPTDAAAYLRNSAGPALKNVADKWMQCGADGIITASESSALAEAINSARNALTEDASSVLYRIADFTRGWWWVYQRRTQNYSNPENVGKWAQTAVSSARNLVWYTITDDSHECDINKSFVCQLSGELAAKLVTVTVEVAPAGLGLQFVVDDVTYTESHSFIWIAGSSHDIEAPNTQVGYEFYAWSDNGERMHSVVPLADGNYIAVYSQAGGVDYESSSSEDAVVLEEYPNVYIGNGDGSLMYVQYPSGKCVDSLVKYDLKSIPVGSTVNDVELELTVAAYSTYYVYLKRVSSCWNETNVTYNTRPTYTDLIAFDNLLNYPKWTWKSSSCPILLSTVQEWVNKPATNYGFSLHMDPGSTTPIFFYTSEESTSSRRPVLRVNYTPPTTGTLTVNLGPSCVPSAGARWKLTDAPNTGYHKSGDTTNLPVGEYTIYFKDIDGWARPVSHNAKITIGPGANIRSVAYTCASPFYYTTDNGKVTITDYSGTDGNIVIPSTINCCPVTSIGNWAFYNRTDLVSVTVSDNVTNIGMGAFNRCSNLNSVTVGNGVTSIGDSAFSRCTSLTNVAIGNSVVNIGNSAFWGCSSLERSSLCGHTASIGDWAFAGCSGLASVMIPESVTNLGTGAFSECVSMTNVTIGNGVSGIEDYALELCRSLSCVTIGENVARIGHNAFQGCTNLVGVSIPNSVTNIGNCAFENCESLSNVTMGGGVTSIGDMAFLFCPSLKSIAIAPNVTNIGHSAFYQCYSLTNIMIPANVAQIGAEAFSGCTSLTSLKVDASNSVYCDIGGILFNIDKTVLLQCPGGKTGTYIIPGTVTSICSKAFYLCFGLTDVVIPASVTSIGEWAFEGCGIYGVTIGSGIINIGEGTFWGCNDLGRVTISASVTNIGSYAFENCLNLVAVYFMGNAPSVGNEAFTYDEIATVFYWPGTTGWGATFGGRPTAIWPPEVSNDGGLGVKSNRFGFNINWASGKVVVVDASTNLKTTNWLPIATNTLTGGPLNFGDTRWTNYIGRFYRIRSP